MNIVFFTNYVNHHQIPWADEMYKISGGNFYYVEVCDTKSLLKEMSGYPFIDRPYVLRVYENNKNKTLAIDLALNSDIMIWDTQYCLQYAIARYKAGKQKYTFEFSERWLKRGFLNLISPRLIRNILAYHFFAPKKTTYALCASAYLPNDEYLLKAYKDRCLKWAYFTAVPQLDIDEVWNKKRSIKPIKILYVSRFIWWKHPERILHLASKLRELKVDFVIDMVGEGPKVDFIIREIKKYRLSDYVHLLGIIPNADLLKLMQEYHIFCFTSDRNEGWGTVLNEAMSNGCCPVACKDIGSAPYLINDGVNGFLFDDKIKDDLFEKVYWLVKHPNNLELMGKEAYKTMYEVWNPVLAAKKFWQICLLMLNGEYFNSPFTDGPLSHAIPYK